MNVDLNTKYETTIQNRTEAAAFKATGGRVYTARAVCTCGYRGKWCPVGHANDLAAAHDCNK